MRKKILSTSPKMKGGKKQLFKYRLKADQVLVTGESRDSKMKMQQPGLAVSTPSPPNTSASQRDRYPLTLKEKRGTGPRIPLGETAAPPLKLSLVSARARLWMAQSRRGRWSTTEDGAPAASGIRGAAELRKTSPRATAAMGHPARGLRVPVPLVPGLASPPRPYPRPQAVRCPPAGFSPALAWPDRTVPSGKRRVSG